MSIDVIDSDYIIAAVPVTLIDVLWDKIEPMVKRVVDVSNREITVESAHNSLMKGETLLCAICRDSDIVAVNIIDIRTLDSGIKVLYIPVTGGGELDGWLDQFMVFAERLAKMHECQEIRGFAVRRGWLRKLKEYGWEEMSITIGKQVEY